MSTVANGSGGDAGDVPSSNECGQRLSFVADIGLCLERRADRSPPVRCSMYAPFGRYETSSGIRRKRR